MARRGCYRFGNATVKKKFVEIRGGGGGAVVVVAEDGARDGNGNGNGALY